MDESNVKRFVSIPKVNEIKAENVELSKESEKQIEQFVDNNVTMANNWIGAAGDGFLFTANTISSYLTFTMEFFDANQDLLGKYELTFGDIDKQLEETNKLEEH